MFNDLGDDETAEQRFNVMGTNPNFKYGNLHPMILGHLYRNSLTAVGFDNAVEICMET